MTKEAAWRGKRGDYPVGTKAFAVNGGHWTRVESGWKWHTGDTFPMLAADAFEVEVPLTSRDAASDSATPRSEEDIRKAVVGKHPTPASEGFYWGSWRIKDEGTADENDPPGKEWEVMHVVENCLDKNDPEYLMVMVPGVAKWQSLENFVWGPKLAVLHSPADREGGR